MLESGGHLVATINIPVGDHIKAGPFNIDTIYTTLIAAGLVLGMGLYLAKRSTPGVPGKLQLVWELVTDAVGDQFEQGLGPKYRDKAPMAITIFLLVLCSDWIEMLPGLFHNTDYLPSPSADVNFCYALGVTVWIATNYAGIKANGFGHWASAFFHPIHVIEHVTRPLTLALRLFGNIFAGGIMIALLLALPKYLYPGTIILSLVWKLFDMFIGLMQAFIFALLTTLYYQFSVESH